MFKIQIYDLISVKVHPLLLAHFYETDEFRHFDYGIEAYIILFSFKMREKIFHIFFYKVPLPVSPDGFYMEHHVIRPFSPAFLPQEESFSQIWISHVL